ncbi:16S rRNA (uracil(1498)-N(3))-methyltransferase [Mycoplasmopsis glycophila]|uniref:Ribosomal RNA small subunit methyltransferase E n=1 Tax=Mycoplasmopsis glycophila TaxID=171285 RepID=A0A449AV45_9BACT|nr:16S rRNA (uracil(1498)-N(3))-methyltransferase [Mycoplasmopsis glycophila]VEU70358.1 RsmE family RNA methyltransferase [Mycoplasmopsis glycophila]
MNRFFVTEKQGESFLLSKENLQHLKVIRIGEKPFICVYQNEFYECVLEIEKAKIIRKISENHEYPFEVILAISVIKFERFEWLLQKATELGVTKIIPMISEHTNFELLKYDKFEKKRERFETILKNAAEQSFRNIIPHLTKLMKFEEVIKIQADFRFLAHEKNNLSMPIKNNIDGNVLFLVGPEGGFSDKENLLAIENGVNSVSLGSRILRAETACLFLLSQLKIY